MRVTKRIEFDSGHRVPNHKSKCRNLHGHRYFLECTLEGPIQPDKGQSAAGMVLDFGDIKATMMAKVHDRFDHAFIVYAKDEEVKEFLERSGTVSVVVDFVPTAENLAQHIFDDLDTEFRSVYSTSLILTLVRLYETPNSWADATSRSSPQTPKE